MMKRLLLWMVNAIAGPVTVVRARTADAAFQFRMGAGFPGEVNRVHPASVEPTKIDGTNPPNRFGDAVLIDGTSNGSRKFIAGDTAVTMPWGFAVRPYPFQRRTGGDSDALGSATPPTAGAMDVLRAGYILAQLNDVAATPKKGDPVFVWCAATSGIHVQGGVEVVASGGNTAALDPNKFQFNGAPDSSGVVEISANV